MLKDLFPRKHSRFSATPMLGAHVEGFVAWLQACGYPALPIRLRVREVPRVAHMLRRRGVRRIEDLSAADVLALAPKDSQDDIHLAAVARSLSRYFESRGLLRRDLSTPLERLVGEYDSHLDRVRGLASSTRTQHAATASEFLGFARFKGAPGRLRALSGRDVEAFLRSVGPRLSRESLQHTVGHVRSLLRFLASRGQVTLGLDRAIDTPRTYRGERLPRSLSWDTVREFLRAIDRSSAMGKRDYAIFLLVATYGLRTSEIAALRLDDVEWRSRRLKVPRPKAGAPLVLPLTDDVGAALVDYRRRTSPACFVPDPSTFPATRPPRRPHIFSEQEILRLLRATAGLHPGPNSPLHGESYRLAVVLLYTAGLRRGELVRLVLSDYDPGERTLLVRRSKFHKSRMVALSGDAAREMEAYLRARRRLAHGADAPLLVVSHRGLRARSGGGLGQGMRRLFRLAGVTGSDGRSPHVHDIRHTYAVHALLRWYRAGVDVQAKLPALATSMGHVSVASTAYYLALLDPVAEAASARFERHCAKFLAGLALTGGAR